MALVLLVLLALLALLALVGEVLLEGEEEEGEGERGETILGLKEEGREDDQKEESSSPCKRWRKTLETGRNLWKRETYLRAAFRCSLFASDPSHK